jgi:hypothetical protein
MSHRKPNLWPRAKQQATVSQLTAARTPEVCPMPQVPPSIWARTFLNFEADPRQAAILDCNDRRVIVLTARQVGKSTIAALRAVYVALTQPGALIILVGPVGAQAGEILAKARRFLAELGLPIRGDGNNPRSLALPNGSRLVARPSVADSIRGYSQAALIIIDEAAWVPASTFEALSPILATGQGSLWVLSTPHGQNGRFAELWHSPEPHWTRFEIRAADCPRLPAEFLAQERALHGERFYAQEYDCQFLSAGVQLLSRAQIEAACVPEAAQASAGLEERTELFLGLDLGKRQDHSALVAAELTFQRGPRNPVTQAIPLIPTLTVRYAAQLPLETETTRLPRLVRDVAQRFAPSCYAPKQKGTLLVDATGNGHTIIELLRADALPGFTLVPVVFTAGQVSNHLKGNYRSIPRADLLARLQMVFETGKLRLHAEAPGIEALLRELRYFEPDGRQAEHDDLVMALAMGVWWAVEHHPGLLGLKEPPRGRLV